MGTSNRDSLDVEAVEKIFFDKSRGNRAAKFNLTSEVSLALSDIHGLEPKSFKLYNGAIAIVPDKQEKQKENENENENENVKEDEKENSEDKGTEKVNVKGKETETSKEKKGNKASNHRKPPGTKEARRSRNRTNQLPKTSKKQQRHKIRSKNRKKSSMNHEFRHRKKSGNVSKRKQNESEHSTGNVSRRKQLESEHNSVATSNFPSPPPPRTMVTPVPSDVQEEVNSLQTAAKEIAISSVEKHKEKTIGLQSSPRSHLVSASNRQSLHTIKNGSVRRISTNFEPTKTEVESSPRSASVENLSVHVQDRIKKYTETVSPTVSPPPLSSKNGRSGSLRQNLQSIEANLADIEATIDAVLQPTKGVLKSIQTVEHSVLQPTKATTANADKKVTSTSTASGATETDNQKLQQEKDDSKTQILSIPTVLFPTTNASVAASTVSRTDNAQNVLSKKSSVDVSNVEICKKFELDLLGNDMSCKHCNGLKAEHIL